MGVSADTDTKTVEQPTQRTLRDHTSEQVDRHHRENKESPHSTPNTPPCTPSPKKSVDSVQELGEVKDPAISSDKCSLNSDDNNKESTPLTSPSIKTIRQELGGGFPTSENATLLIREFLNSKLAAVTEMMEQGLGLIPPRDFSQTGHFPPSINNNDFSKESSHAATIMSLLKVRQEMALNMSKDSSDSDRQSNDSPTGHISFEEDDKDVAMDLQHNGRSPICSDGEVSPASPSSDAGMSTSSNKDPKVSRLENIVGGLSRSTSSPVPPAQGCKKRKLYQPVQHDGHEDEEKHGNVSGSIPNEEEPEEKKIKHGIENQIKSMQDQFVRLQERIHGQRNDENADPEERELQIDLSNSDRRNFKDEITIEKRPNSKHFAPFGHPLLNGSAEPLPLPPTSLSSNYMDLAKRFLQEQQDKVTKELITKDIVNCTIGKNEIADKLAAISPELDGLADILKLEISSSLTIIVDSIVQKFLASKRQSLGKINEESKTFNNSKTPSGRAPQVRDRSTPRSVFNPVSMANPLSMSNAMNKGNNLIPTTSSVHNHQQTRISVHAPVDLQKVHELQNLSPPNSMMQSLYPPTSNGRDSGMQLSEDEREDTDGEQDDALNLVVTPKKKRHKVTDTRITPKTVSRLLGGGIEPPCMSELQKHFGPASPFMPPGFPMPKLLGDLPRPPFPGVLPPAFLPNIPTSATHGMLSHHPHLHQEFPFNPFFPGHLNRPRDLSPPIREPRPRSASPPRDHRPPPPLLHPAILAAQSPEFGGHLKHMPSHDPDMNRPASSTSSDEFKFEKMEFGQSPFSLANMAGGYGLSDGSHNATLTPMHLRKAKLMFFWVRYPSSAILKMYFPDIKFNKNNTAQLVKWFSNFREFYYIQMEKYARQALSEGVKNLEDIHVSMDSELYRGLNLHYNRNNHIEVPDHFLPVTEHTLREFVNSIRVGKDAEPSWKKQIYKIIARYDEPIPDYFKTQEFLQQLE